MYICESCGKIFEEDEICEIQKEEHIFGDFSISRTITKCFSEGLSYCGCGGDIVKAVHCEKCDSFVPKGNFVCEDCLEEYKTLDVALDIGEEWDGVVSLNGFLLSFYSREDIEQILLDSIRNEREEKVKRAVERYCNEDKECFKECAERKWREEKSYI